MEITRRKFISRSKDISLGAGLGCLFPHLKLWAWDHEADQKDHLFVLVRTFGGMDVTLGLDPQILPAGADSQDMFLEYRPEDILQVNEVLLGPAAKALVAWVPQCLILNGVMMRRDAGHDVINQYMITGRGDGKAASVAVELGLAMGQSPFGIIGNQGIYVAGKPANLSTTQDIIAEADQSELIRWIEERLEHLASEQATPFEDAQKQMVAGKESAKKIQDLLEQFKKDYGKLEDKHALAAVFASGGAQHAEFNLPITAFLLDTHSNHEGNHLKVQTELWNLVADLFTLFSKVPYLTASLWDYTTFVVISEWSRTPYLNAAKGKDHNPYTNSVLFAGKGIQKGRVIGKSRLITRKQTGTWAEHIAWPYNYKEQKLAEKPEGASFFYPENVIKTLGHIFGNPKGFKPVSESVPLIPGLAR